MDKGGWQRDCLSSIKRTFGEHVAARKFPNMTKELILKPSLYNMFATMM
jgi:hypothetical protein